MIAFGQISLYYEPFAYRHIIRSHFLGTFLFKVGNHCRRQEFHHTFWNGSLLYYGSILQ